MKILEVAKELPALVLNQYNSVGLIENAAKFGWPYMDSQGGVFAGELVSVVGKIALGKTWMSLYIALQNWKGTKNVLFVSMEMSILLIAQRIAAMYTGCTITQLKNSAFSNKTYSKFVQSIALMKEEKSKFYVIDGNLAVNVEDIFTLADMLECTVIVIDGGYLVRHPDKRLDRYMRVAENSELIKRSSEDQKVSSFVSWQFAKTAGKKKSPEDVDLDDIGSSVAIGQSSSIVLGMFQEEGIETLVTRKIRVLKGRSGEVGSFVINWDFIGMDFKQIDPPIDGKTEDEPELDWL